MDKSVFTVAPGTQTFARIGLDVVSVHVATIYYKLPVVKRFFKKFGAMHFIYYINRSITTKVDSTYMGY